MDEQLLAEILRRLGKSLDQRSASGLSLPRALLSGVAEQLRAAADLIESQQARIEALEGAMTDVLAHIDAHPPISQNHMVMFDADGSEAHGHDCYEAWCIERHHARFLLAAGKPKAN